MSRFSDLLSPGARELSRHSLGPPRAQAANGNETRLIRLDSNENPLGPSPRALEAMRSALGKTNLYPDDDCGELRGKLAAHYGVSPEQTLVTAGSTGLLNLLCQVLLAPGLNAVTSERSFVVYSQLVRATGAQLIEVPMREDRFDPPAILKAINRETRLVFLANPNNPTGTMVCAEEVEQFLGRIPEHVIVAHDEAYYEYAAHFALRRGAVYSRSIDRVKRGASEVVLRTFSKIHGLAGLRVGYGFGPAELLTCCAQMRTTYSVASPAEAAALAAMDDRDHMERTLQLNFEQAQVLSEGLTELGYRVTETWANFLYFDVGEDARAFAARLLEAGVVVRPLAVWGAPNSVRVSIGTPEENRFFLEAVRRVDA